MGTLPIRPRDSCAGMVTGFDKKSNRIFFKAMGSGRTGDPGLGSRTVSLNGVSEW